MTDRALNLFFLALAALGGLLACLTYTGCTTYTVLPADREVVPIRQSVPDEAARRRTYVEAVDGATGWYVPDSVMVELLDAD